MTQPPQAPSWPQLSDILAAAPVPDGHAPAASVHLRTSAGEAAELRELAQVIAEGIHALSHFAGQIAADLHAIRAAVDRQESVLGAYSRGGRLAAMTAARQQKKHGGISDDNPTDSAPGGPGTARAGG